MKNDPTAPKRRSSERRWRALLGRTAEELRGSEKVFGQGVRANFLEGDDS
jgi:hypothetical protein